MSVLTEESLHTLATRRYDSERVDAFAQMRLQIPRELTSIAIANLHMRACAFDPSNFFLHGSSLS